MGNIKQPTVAPRGRTLQSLSGCTIARVSELPQALVLAASFQRFHPESHFAILVLDGAGDPESPADTMLLSLGDVCLAPGGEWHLPMLYDAQQLARILKPTLLHFLIERDSTVVVYFEVTTEIFGSVSDIGGVILAADAIFATEPVYSALGDDLGPSFVAARRGAQKTLRQWFDRLQTPGSGGETISRVDPAAAQGDSLDSIPHQIIRTPGFALGYWNLNPETFAWTGEHYEVHGTPLRSFDFRGYDPGKPHLLSKHQGPKPRILLSECPVVARICDEYQRKVVQAGYNKRKRAPYRFDYLPSGLRIDHRMLRLYREAYGRHKQGLEKEPPSPFGPEGEEGFLNWLNEPVGKTPPVVTRYMLAVYEDREDVKNAFPNPTGVNADGFRNWYLHFGQRELGLPAMVIPSDARPATGAQAGELDSMPAARVNVAGYFRAELGIGAAARSVVAALEESEIPFNTISFDGTASRQAHPFSDRQAEGGTADINIVCINADQLPAFAAKTGPELWAGHYTIGLWFWEVEDFPPLFHGAFNYVDEVWVASDFMRETFLKVSPKPVFKFKLPVPKPEIDLSLSRADLGLPNRFLFLFSFDLFSVLERKNPVGLIEAFSRAFRPGEGPVLIIKTINGDKRIREMEKLRYAARGRPDIILRDGYLSPVETSTLTALADCYVSLHRSEGFGLTIAEAMSLSKPTIATAYSGNLEFMTEENSYLCSSRRAAVGPDHEPYPAESHWSEPDLEEAARLLRHVYEHRDEAGALGVRAASDMRSFHSPSTAGAIIRERIATIRRRRAAPPSRRSIAFLEDRIEELETELAKLRAK